MAAFQTSEPPRFSSAYRAVLACSEATILKLFYMTV